MTKEKECSDPLDREVCVCFHVPLRKLAKFHRLRRPKLATQFSECYSAGTGCGWCVPFLKHLFEQLEEGLPPELELSPEEYMSKRAQYHKDQKKNPPPSTSSDC